VLDPLTNFIYFRHPWETVVHAAFRKYPNPMNKAITAIDVVRQDVDQGKLLKFRGNGDSFESVNK
jgi:hypothetical protein